MAGPPGGPRATHPNQYDHDAKIVVDDSQELCVLRSLSLQLMTFRDTNETCDVTITIQDRTFTAHKYVLASSSGYFRTMFNVDCKERNEAKITLEEMEDLSCESLQTLLDFMYSGKMSLSKDTVFDVLACACYLQIESAVKVCSKFIEKEFLKPVFCEKYIDLHEVATSYALDNLKSLAVDYMAKNFDSFVNIREFQQDMTSVCLEDLLSREDLAIFTEKEVFHAVTQWLTHDWNRRKQHAISLLGKVRLCLVPFDDIVPIFTSHPFQDNAYCLGLFEDIMEYHFEKGETDFSSLLVSEWDLMSTPRTAKKMLVASNTHTDYFDVKTNQWYSMRNFPDANREEHCMISYNGSIVIAGGNRHNIHLMDIMILNTESMKWEHVACMKQARSNFTLVAFGKEFYAIGGYNNESGFIVDVERFEVCYDGTWTRKSAPPMPTAFKSKTRPSAVIHKGRVLVVGMSATDNHKCGPILMYTPPTNKWEIIADSQPTTVSHAVYFMTEREQLFVVIFGKYGNNFYENGYHKWESGMVVECDLFFDDIEPYWSYVRVVPEVEFAYEDHKFQAFQIGGKVYIMFNNFPFETLLRVHNYQTDLVSLAPYRQLCQLLETSAVTVLSLDWKKTSPIQKNHE